MVRKRRTELPGTGEASEPQESSGGSGRGVPQPPGERTPIPQQGGGGRSWGSGSSQQSQQGGRGGGYYHSRGGGQPRGGMVPQHPGGPPSELQGRGGAQSHGGMVPRQPGGLPPEFQGRGGPRPRGGTPPRQYHGGRRGGGAGPSSSRGSSSFPGPSGPSAPELHQATQAPHQALPPLQSQASSSSQPPEVAVQQQLQQLSIQGESSSSIIIQPATTVVASSKSMRFPLRPGKGSYGDRCVVKANHFFAELPDKDLHQYDVSFLLGFCIFDEPFTPLSCRILISLVYIWFQFNSCGPFRLQ